MVYDYSPYGERTSESLEGTEAAALSPFGFTGAYQFQDGTVHLNHRFHSTFTLGFTQPDPSRQEMNNYAYAACDPINNTDPTGLQTYQQCFATSAGSMAATGIVTGAVTGLWGGPVGGLAGAALGFYGGLLGGAVHGGINC
ncbi:RHS repeat-associated core domain-containing protein [Nocardiopsis sp. RV163]|uniref:RHS repeat-associated core domain-containing protein n=1 Tax=Nocardiopsis sp. RV163 TaxID=1661388 RepID=UPI00064BA3AD|nr:RHS repeat-associated core domain-containing protein [Nocardiopsis sp. RV163]